MILNHCILACVYCSMLQRQMLAEAAAVYNRMHQRMQSYAIHLLKSGGQKSFARYVHKWRASAARAHKEVADDELAGKLPDS